MEHDPGRERTRARRLEKLRFWRSACSDERPVVTHYSGAANTPRLFFFHGDWDNGGLYMAKLAAWLGAPVAALAPHLGPVPTSIRAMAQDRLPDILAAQPEGPYRIGGFCNGALVAYEAAQLLIEQGRAVEMVLLVAPPSLNAGRSYRRILDFVERLLGASGPDAPPARRQRAATLMGRLTALRRLRSYSLHEWKVVLLRKQWQRLAAWKRIRPERGRTPAELCAEAAIHQRRRTLLAGYSEAIHLYRPAPMPARLVVFGTGLDEAGRPGSGYDAAYDGRAWSELCVQAEYVPVPGDHYTCIADHAVELARAMAGALDAAPDAQAQPERRAQAGAPRAARAEWLGRSARLPEAALAAGAAALAGPAGFGFAEGSLGAPSSDPGARTNDQGWPS